MGNGSDAIARVEVVEDSLSSFESKLNRIDDALSSLERVVEQLQDRLVELEAGGVQHTEAQPNHSIGDVVKRLNKELIAREFGLTEPKESE